MRAPVLKAWGLDAHRLGLHADATDNARGGFGGSRPVAAMTQESQYMAESAGPRRTVSRGQQNAAATGRQTPRRLRESSATG